MKFEKITLNNERNVILECYTLDNSKEFQNIKKRPAILVFSGGYIQCVQIEKLSLRVVTILI